MGRLCGQNESYFNPFIDVHEYLTCTAMSKMVTKFKQGRLLSFPGARPRTAPSARAGVRCDVHASHVVRRAAGEVGDEIG